MNFIPPSPPRPASPDFNSPFWSITARNESILEDIEELTGEEKAATEKFFKDQENQTKRTFMQEVRRKQFAHVFRSEVNIKK